MYRIFFAFPHHGGPDQCDVGWVEGRGRMSSIKHLFLQISHLGQPQEINNRGFHGALSAPQDQNGREENPVTYLFHIEGNFSIDVSVSKPSLPHSILKSDVPLKASVRNEKETPLPPTPPSRSVHNRCTLKNRVRHPSQLPCSSQWKSHDVPPLGVADGVPPYRRHGININIA